MAEPLSKATTSLFVKNKHNIFFSQQKNTSKMKPQNDTATPLEIFMRDLMGENSVQPFDDNSRHQSSLPVNATISNYDTEVTPSENTEDKTKTYHSANVSQKL